MTNIAWVATAIADYLATRGTAVLVCDDDQQAEALAEATAAIVPGHDIVFMPSSDALPGDAAPASPANVGNRVAALHRLRTLQSETERAAFACILSGEAAARRYPPPVAFDSAPPTLRTGDTIEAAAFETLLETLGYWSDDRVDEPGEMAVRGDVIDIFPADAGQPVRIELADGKVSALRSYDPITQRTLEPREAVELGRASEPGVAKSVPITDHFTDVAIGFTGKAVHRRARFVALAADAAQRTNAPLDAIDEACWARSISKLKPLTISEVPGTVPRFAERKAPLAAFAAFAKPLLENGTRIILAGGARDLRFLRPRVAKRLGMPIAEIDSWRNVGDVEAGSVAMLVMPVRTGFVNEHVALVAAGDLLGSRALLDDGIAGSNNHSLVRSAEIRVGDIVIHEDHGVAKVAGLEMIAGGVGGEAIVLEYAAGARRLVPAIAADKIWRYGADADAVTLDRLNGNSWRKRRGEIDVAIAESARGLAALAEERRCLTANVLEPMPADYEQFASGFSFNETADQARAIMAVRDDLASGRPMDRLVVGDVGFGKTEVALRAAALAALAGYQVAVAAPTTVLVRQHVETFTRRFKASGIAVAGLSRLSSAAERRAVKAGLRDGSIGVVIGTGAIMAKDVTYRSLGLVIIDEEQRFGAADKLRLRGDVGTHLLSLSATPIPRTLQMALLGLQQISVIATPPARRQPIRTSLDQFDAARLRTALLREKGRGGQSFVVVPRIEDMTEIAQRLEAIVPDMSIIQAHGKLPPAEVDNAMVEFADGVGDILLSTNIIEAGLDVPRANTMIIWRADRFGLSQLHQLRGRVGRGNRRGQVMLLTDDQSRIGERTVKRLRALAAFDRLGAGFDISAHDLDMRGAGDLLGDAQAGHIKLIGVELYQTLLEAALRHARGEDAERWTPELRLGSEGGLPESWIPEPDTRLSLYVRLARAADMETIEALEDELIDRFGPLPSETDTLLRRARIGALARLARVARIDAGPSAIALTPYPGSIIDAPHAGLVEKDGRVLLTEKLEPLARLERLQNLLEELIIGTTAA